MTDANRIRNILEGIELKQQPKQLLEK
jgi:hypothetical protein